MVMESIWENAISVSGMEKEYIYSRMALFMKVPGTKAKERVGVYTSMQMGVNILENIKEDKEKEQVCMNILIKRSTKEVGKKIRRMAMA
jgi:hypothetical protein